MKKGLFLLLTFVSSFTFSQSTDNVDTLRANAKSYLQEGDYEKAIQSLNEALQLQPNDLQTTKDLVFANYLKRDFAKSMELGKPLVARDDADVQSFQMLGLTYKAIAEDDKAEELYKLGLKKFPNEAVLYSEYGDLLARKKPDASIKLWEKGVEIDANHSSNYFFLAKQYAESGDMLWSMLYAEMFLNMESFTARSTEIKNLLLGLYKKFFTTEYQPPTVTQKRGINKKADRKFVQFTSAVAETLKKQQSQATSGITPETLTIIRTRFILDWYNTHASNFPFRLFENQRQLLKEGMFEAYNYWLFGPAANIKSYQLWQQNHQEELNTFLSYIRGRVFKVPEGQNYYYAVAK